MKMTMEQYRQALAKGQLRQLECIAEQGKMRFNVVDARRRPRTVTIVKPDEER
jgi:hypothetical protein